VIFFSPQALRLAAEQAFGDEVTLLPTGKEPRPLLETRHHVPKPQDDLRQGAMIAVLRKS
jgi:hypothetical protein